MNTIVGHIIRFSFKDVGETEDIFLHSLCAAIHGVIDEHDPQLTRWLTIAKEDNVDQLCAICGAHIQSHSRYEEWLGEKGDEWLN